MFIPSHHSQGNTDTKDNGTTAELAVRSKPLRPLAGDIGLMDIKYGLAYCNSGFDTMLEDADHRAPTKVVLLHTMEQLQEILHQLEKAEFWLAVFPEIEKSFKLISSRIDIPVPASLFPSADAHFILMISIHFIEMFGKNNLMPEPFKLQFVLNEPLSPIKNIARNESKSIYPTRIEILNETCISDHMIGSTRRLRLS